MRVEITYDELPAEIAEIRQLSLITLAELNKELRGVSLSMERRIKSEMPVDTGRARASWGHWTPEDVNRVAIGAMWGPSDALWNESTDGLSIEQGSNVEYIGALNDGHSVQAPAGFIDLAEEAAVRELDNKVSQILDRKW